MRSSLKIGLIGLVALVFTGCGDDEKLANALQKYLSEKKAVNAKFFDVKSTMKAVESSKTPFGKMYTFKYDYVVTAKEKTCLSKGRFKSTTLQVVKYDGVCLSKGGEIIDKGATYKSKIDKTENINEMVLKKYMI